MKLNANTILIIALIGLVIALILTRGCGRLNPSSEGIDVYQKKLQSIDEHWQGVSDSLIRAIELNRDTILMSRDSVKSLVSHYDSLENVKTRQHEIVLNWNTDDRIRELERIGSIHGIK